MFTVKEPYTRVYMLRKLHKTLVLVIFSVYIIYNILFSLFNLEKVTVTEFVQRKM